LRREDQEERKVREVETGTRLAFGDLLRRHRASASITQEELALRTGLTPQAIGLLERGERRRPHAYTVQVLGEALGLEGREFAEFEASARGPAARAMASEPPRRAMPVPPTPLVGRETEVASVTGLLRREDVRLVTLTGPGGVGKTRLALEVAARVTGSRGAFADGVAFVPLAPLQDPDLVPSVVAQTLGVKDPGDQSLQEALIRHLEDKQLLLLLDNFEHLLEAVPLAAELVRGCPGLTVLATSRAPLRLSGERQYPLSPLSLVAGASLERSPAVRLFEERAREVSPGFEVRAGNEAAVAEICRRLDGLPLAIELAAAKVKLFSPKALLDRLELRLPLLSGGARDLPERQQTLRDTVAWSYELLGPTERALFGRLAVFAGGFSLEAAEAVCGPGMPEEVLEILASLVDNSLVVSRVEAASEPGGDEPRFAMLETVREYAAERLGSDGEAEQVHRAHAMYYLELAEATQPEVSSQTLTGWLVVLEREHDNMRAALRWAIRCRQVDFGTRLALALWRFWPERHHVSEGRRWLEAMLALGRPADVAEGSEPTLPLLRWAFLHLVTGMLTAEQGDYDRGVALYEESLTLYRNMGHRKGMSGPLRELGALAYRRGDYEQAVRLSQQALAISREFGSAFGSGLAVCTLSDALRAQGDLERARMLLEESAVSLRRTEYPLRVANALAITLSRLGSIECQLGSEERASGLFRESLRLARRFGFTFDAVICLEGMARVAAQEDPVQAARLLGVSAAQRLALGTSLPPVARTDHDHAANAARAALGEEPFEAAWAAGYAMSLEEAISEVVGKDG
jgi:predicted ATPase/DNA-binding XRE family transcriptional regulator